MSMRRVAATAVLTLSLGLVAACSGSNPDGIATRVERGKPVLVTAPPVPVHGKDVELTVRQGGGLDILTWGSGSCPYVPVDLERLDKRRVRVVMEARSNSANDVCTADLAPTVATVDLPDDVNYRDSFFVHLEGVGPKRALGVRLGFTNGGGNIVRTPN